MNMGSSVYEYGIRGKCVHKFRHTYAGIREMKMQLEKESRNMSSFMCASIGIVTKVSIKFVEKEERKQKGGYEYRTEHKARSARNRGRKTGREESIHKRQRLIEKGKQTRKVREGDRGYYWESAKVGDSHSEVPTQR